MLSCPNQIHIRRVPVHLRTGDQVQAVRLPPAVRPRTEVVAPLVTQHQIILLRQVVAMLIPAAISHQTIVLPQHLGDSSATYLVAIAGTAVETRPRRLLCGIDGVVVRAATAIFPVAGAILSTDRQDRHSLSLRDLRSTERTGGPYR